MTCYGTSHVWTWPGSTVGTWPYQGQRCECGQVAWPPPNLTAATKGAA